MHASKLLPVAALAVAGVVAGCGAHNAGTASSSPGAPMDVVATTTQLGDIVRNIGGGAVDVHQILRANTDPHTYEPRPDDIRNTAGARLVIVNGDNLDRWMAKVVKNAGGHPTVLDAGQGRPVALPGERSGPEASRFDPHWWHDPRNVEYAVGRIQGALIQADPAAAAAIREGARNYLRKLRTLDAGIRRCMQKVPVQRRKLVTDHDAFGYFAKRYGIDVVGAVIPSQTTQAQPSAGDLARLASLIKREHVTAVFPETSVNPKLAKAIARETGASADYTLYGDTLGAPSSPARTYLGMEQVNADAMVRGFTHNRARCVIGGL